tara:strand:- start:283 stop:786 length:504 start_codon:yes stop_codon:yes gene_type:complete
MYYIIKNAGENRRFFIPRSQFGFTMIELIATMVIMGILATSLISNYSEFNTGLRIYEEAKDMSRKITYARDYCSARNEKFYLKVDADTDKYSLYYQNNTTALLLPDEGSNEYTLPGYVDITATNIAVAGLEFDALMGEPQSITENATITIDDFTITIENPTGYIHVQ